MILLNFITAAGGPSQHLFIQDTGADAPQEYHMGDARDIYTSRKQIHGDNDVRQPFIFEELNGMQRIFDRTCDF
ncbi:hypothetical protein D3C73_1448570 [compost metagenome]